METKNAIIKSTMLGTEDHGIFTCLLSLDYGHSGQGFGGYVLDKPVKDSDGKFIKRIGSAYGMNFIMRILEVLEVESWENLKGVHCRVKAEHSKVHAIGHILKDNWFDPTELKEDN